MKKILSILFCFISFLGLHSQDVLDLKKCIELGLERNFDIRIIRNEEQITDNNATIGNAGYLPQIDLTAGYAGTINDTEQRMRSNGATDKTSGVHNQTLNAGINLNWTVFDGFNIQANYKKLKELQQKGELSTRLSIENLITQLSEEYYNYIQQTIRLNNLKSAVKLSKERLRIVEARYQIGNLSRLDLQQAKVDFNADSSKLIKQYEVLYTSRISLNQLMAADRVDQQIITADTAIVLNHFLNQDDIFERTLKGNSLLLLSEKDKQISLLDLKATQSQYFPYVKVNAGYGYTQNMYETGSFDRQKNLGFNYGVTIGFNLFDGFNRKRKKKNAQLEVQNRELSYSQLQTSVKADLANIWMAYRNNIELVNLEQENVQTARDNYEIAIDRYKLGDLSGIELREAQNSLLEAEERLVQAQYSTKMCEISLMQISGQIIEYVDLQ
jgi:outer membrane protein TolC